MRYLCIVLLALASGCQGETSRGRTTLTMWHFWSEPSQRAALDSLIRDFERHHPDIDVQCTELQWGDGKAKLQLAFNAGTSPDVVHLGLDWFAEFDAGGVFAELPDSLGTDGRAARWVVNARALVENVDVADSTVGLCANDAHNVLKRDLPWIWQAGSELYVRTPIAAGLDASLVDALWALSGTIVPRAVIDQSRRLDERLLNAELRMVYTGPWIVDMARRRSITSLRITPSVSILNADVLAVSARSTQASAAHRLIAYLRAYPQARRLCMSVSDAGFPADLDAASRDSAFTVDPLRHGFLRTAMRSRVLPHTPTLLSVEPVVEDMLVRWYDARSRADVARIVAEARAAVTAIESR
jgi:hypothetical protein